MDKKKLEFIRLVERALEIAKQMRSENQAEGLNTEQLNTEQLNNVIGRLQAIKNQARADQLESSQGISTLGLAREVADWIDSLDSPLLKAVGTIEQYYQRHY